MKCMICDQKGHWARLCPNIDRNRDHKSKPESYIAAAYISDVSVFYSKTIASVENLWLADSGASMHMTFKVLSENF